MGLDADQRRVIGGVFATGPWLWALKQRSPSGWLMKGAHMGDVQGLLVLVV
jgi:hypothetical protein